VASGPKCGECGRPLLLDRPITVTDQDFERVLAGTEVAVEMVSPIGDPTAYRVRGTVVALRRDQAGLIRIASEKQAAA